MLWSELNIIIEISNFYEEGDLFLSGLKKITLLLTDRYFLIFHAFFLNSKDKGFSIGIKIEKFLRSGLNSVS